MIYNYITTLLIWTTTMEVECLRIPYAEDDENLGMLSCGNML